MTPLKSVSPTTVVDRYDFQLSFYKDVESIIRELVENDVKIIAASRTATPILLSSYCQCCIFREGQQSSTFIVYNGARDQRQSISKQQRKSKMTTELTDGEFILFDDEWRNRDVESINCHFAHVPDESVGLTRHILFKN